MVPRFFFCFQRFAGLLELQKHCRDCRTKGKIADEITHKLPMGIPEEIAYKCKKAFHMVEGFFFT